MLCDVMAIYSLVQVWWDIKPQNKIPPSNNNISNSCLWVWLPVPWTLQGYFSNDCCKLKYFTQTQRLKTWYQTRSVVMWMFNSFVKSFNNIWIVPHIYILYVKLMLLPKPIKILYWLYSTVCGKLDVVNIAVSMAYTDQILFNPSTIRWAIKLFVQKTPIFTAWI